MKAVLIDRSLCSTRLREDVRPEHIYGYIKALADAGVKYVELDFHSVMKLEELPEGIGYIFRMRDPAFAELANVFDFSYVVVTLDDIRKRFKLNAPAIMELPSRTHLTHGLMRMINSQLNGRLGMVRLCGDFGMMSAQEASKFVFGLKNSVTLPVDLCPTNDGCTALDSAVKFTFSGADSVTLCTGSTRRFACFEEFMFTLLSVFASLPDNIDFAAMLRASYLRRLVFADARDCVGEIMQRIDHDISSLTNADTGESVRMRMKLRDSRMLHKYFVTAIERMAEEENIPEDIIDDISGALAHFDLSLFSPEISRDRPVLLN